MTLIVELEPKLGSSTVTSSMSLFASSMATVVASSGVTSSMSAHVPEDAPLLSPAPLGRRWTIEPSPG